MTIVWTVATVAALVALYFDRRIFSFCAVPSAVGALVLSFFVDPLWQILSFIFIYVIFFIPICIYLKPFAREGGIYGDVVGETCVVTVELDNFAGRGQVRVKGQIWAARSVTDEDVYDVGEVLHIVAIDGVRLVCRK